MAGVQRLMAKKGWCLLTNYGGQTRVQLVSPDGRKWDFKIAGGGAWIAAKEG